MPPLSDQLEDLSRRTKNAENSVAAASKKNQAQLERRRDELKSNIESARQKVDTAAAGAKDNVRSGLAEIKNKIDGQLANARAKFEERKAERDLNKAEQRAQSAEDDAADVIAFTAYMIDQSEYAVINAVLARADADNLRAAA
ncbi:MAG: hypothetical protein JWO13_1646 [Acidobacteriales bacterium]|nr:hypothetical protein [Terriglobales bacterium]